MSEKKLEDQQKIIDLQDEIIKVFHNRSDYENEKDLQEELAPLRDKLKGLRE